MSIKITVSINNTDVLVREIGGGDRVDYTLSRMRVLTNDLDDLFDKITLVSARHILLGQEK